MGIELRVGVASRGDDRFVEAIDCSGAGETESTGTDATSRGLGKAEAGGVEQIGLGLSAEGARGNHRLGDLQGNRVRRGTSIRPGNPTEGLSCGLGDFEQNARAIDRRSAEDGRRSRVMVSRQV